MKYKWLIVASRKICLSILLASLFFVSCMAILPDEPPEICPATLDVYGTGWATGTGLTYWSPDTENILFYFNSLNHSPDWYIVSLKASSVESFETKVQLPEIESRIWSLVWSPTDNVIVFSDDNVVYSLDFTSGKANRLTHGGGKFLWSVDGKQISFIRDKNWYIMNADGTNVRHMVEISEIRLEMWHPFEQKILGQLSGDGMKDQPENIGVIDASDGTITQLTDTRDCEYHPRWSPDGSQIAFVSTQTNGNRDILVMNADGSNIVNLTNTTPQHEIDFSWSPDGHQIVYTRYHATSPREFSQEIYVMNADGSEQQPLTDTLDEYEFGPVWSPDGKHIAFWSTGGVGQGPDARWWTLNVMNADGSDRRVLATFGPTALESDDSYPAP